HRDADGGGAPRRHPHLFLGLLGISAHADSDDAALGTLLRSLRPPTALPDRAHDLPGWLGAVGRIPEHGAADRVPDGPGARRRRLDDPGLHYHRRAVRSRAAGADAGIHLERVGPGLPHRAVGWRDA